MQTHSDLWLSILYIWVNITYHIKPHDDNMLHQHYRLCVFSWVQKNPDQCLMESPDIPAKHSHPRKPAMVLARMCYNINWAADNGNRCQTLHQLVWSRHTSKHTPKTLPFINKYFICLLSKVRENPSFDGSDFWQLSFLSFVCFFYINCFIQVGQLLPQKTTDAVLNPVSSSSESDCHSTLCLSAAKFCEELSC